jgi:hypothetical protein
MITLRLRPTTAKMPPGGERQQVVDGGRQEDHDHRDPDQ